MAELGGWANTERQVEPRPGVGGEAARRALEVEGQTFALDDAIVVELRPEPSIAVGAQPYGLGDALGERVPVDQERRSARGARRPRSRGRRPGRPPARVTAGALEKLTASSEDRSSSRPACRRGARRTRRRTSSRTERAASRSTRQPSTSPPPDQGKDRSVTERAALTRTPDRGTTCQRRTGPSGARSARLPASPLARAPRQASLDGTRSAPRVLRRLAIARLEIGVHGGMKSPPLPLPLHRRPPGVCGSPSPPRRMSKCTQDSSTSTRTSSWSPRLIPRIRPWSASSSARRSWRPLSACRRASRGGSEARRRTAQAGARRPAVSASSTESIAFRTRLPPR